MYTGVHRFLTFELLVNPPSSGTLAFSLRLAPFLRASDSSALHTGSSASDDSSFIVLTETKFSFRCIPVWDRYSPHRPGLKKKAHVIMLSP